jgi:hypothetical protein
MLADVEMLIVVDDIDCGGCVLVVDDIVVECVDDGVLSFGKVEI